MPRANRAATLASDTCMLLTRAHGMRAREADRCRVPVDDAHVELGSGRREGVAMTYTPRNGRLYPTTGQTLHSPRRPSVDLTA
jgi:hypothetical protein